LTSVAALAAASLGAAIVLALLVFTILEAGATLFELLECKSIISTNEISQKIDRNYQAGHHTEQEWLMAQTKRLRADLIRPYDTLPLKIGSARYGSASQHYEQKCYDPHNTPQGTRTRS
jgi:hypothetical protein